MWNFERKYRAYVEAMKLRPNIYVSKQNLSSQPNDSWANSLEDLLNVFNSFRNIYPGLVVPSANDLDIDNLPRLDFMILDEWYDDEDTEEWAFLKNNKQNKTT